MFKTAVSFRIERVNLRARDMHYRVRHAYIDCLNDGKVFLLVNYPWFYEFKPKRWVEVEDN